jgi:hypothetical protein
MSSGSTWCTDPPHPLTRAPNWQRLVTMVLCSKWSSRTGIHHFTIPKNYSNQNAYTAYTISHIWCIFSNYMCIVYTVYRHRHLYNKVGHDRDSRHNSPRSISRWNIPSIGILLVSREYLTSFPINSRYMSMCSLNHHRYPWMSALNFDIHKQIPNISIDIRPYVCCLNPLFFVGWITVECPVAEIGTVYWQYIR